MSGRTPLTILRTPSTVSVGQLTDGGCSAAASACSARGARVVNAGSARALRAKCEDRFRERRPHAAAHCQRCTDGRLCRIDSWLLTGLYRRAMIASRRLERPTRAACMPRPWRWAPALPSCPLRWGCGRWRGDRSTAFRCCWRWRWPRLAAMSWADNGCGLSPLVVWRQGAGDLHGADGSATESARAAGRAAGTRAISAGPRLAVVHQPLQFHGRHRRTGGERDDRGGARLSGAADLCGPRGSLLAPGAGDRRRRPPAISSGTGIRRGFSWATPARSRWAFCWAG